MALEFNPFRRSGTQSGANVGFSDVLNANKGVGDALAGIGAGIQDIRNVAGDKAVSDLLASGQLQGLDDTTALVRIQQVSGGNISPAMEKNLSALNQSRNIDKKLSATAEQGSLNRIAKAEIARLNRESEENINKAKIKAQKKGSKYIAGPAGTSAIINTITGEHEVIPQIVQNAKTKQKAWKPTGSLNNVWENASKTGKQILESAYNSGDLRAQPIYETIGNKRIKVDDRLMFKGQPVTVAELIEFAKTKG